MSATVEIENVSHSYGKESVLNDVSFQVQHGSVIAVLGENGAGKTTLIKSVLGLLKPKTGSIRVLGMDPRKDSLALKKIVGYVPDQPVVQSWMTINQVGWYAAGFYGDHYAKRFENIANSFGLNGSQRISKLSKGMTAKVSLTLALAMDPQLLVLDEPTSGLDLVVRRTFLEEMVDRASEGNTVWINSHQVSEVERVADQIAVIQKGKLQLIGSLEDLKTQHKVLNISVSDPVLPCPEFFQNSNTISQTRFGRQWRLLVKDLHTESLKSAAEVAEFEINDVSRPSLEDIYLGYSTGEDFMVTGTEDRSDSVVTISS